MSELTKEEIEILIYDKYPFGPISVYESPFGEKEYPPTKYIVPKPKYDPGTRFEYYYEYYRPFVSVFFMMKAIKTLEATGSLDEMKDRKYNKYYLSIEAEKEGLGGAYDEWFEYEFTSEAKELIMMHQINKQLFPLRRNNATDSR